MDKLGGRARVGTDMGGLWGTTPCMVTGKLLRTKSDWTVLFFCAACTMSSTVLRAVCGGGGVPDSAVVAGGAACTQACRHSQAENRANLFAHISQA